MVQVTYYAFVGYECDQYGEDPTPQYEVKVSKFDCLPEAERFIYNYIGKDNLIRVEHI